MMSNGMVLVDPHQPITKHMIAGILDSVKNKLLDFILELTDLDFPVEGESLEPENRPGNLEFGLLWFEKRIREFSEELDRPVGCLEWNRRRRALPAGSRFEGLNRLKIWRGEELSPLPKMAKKATVDKLAIFVSGLTVALFPYGPPPCFACWYQSPRFFQKRLAQIRSNLTQTHGLRWEFGTKADSRRGRILYWCDPRKSRFKLFKVKRAMRQLLSTLRNLLQQKKGGHMEKVEGTSSNLEYLESYTPARRGGLRYTRARVAGKKPTNGHGKEAFTGASRRVILATWEWQFAAVGALLSHTHPRVPPPLCARPPHVHPRGYDLRWRRYAAYLKRHPFCACGCGRRAEVVDHIIPVSRGGAFWDPANHQAMAKVCHDRKTACGDGGFGNRAMVKIVDKG